MYIIHLIPKKCHYSAAMPLQTTGNSLSKVQLSKAQNTSLHISALCKEHSRNKVWTSETRFCNSWTFQSWYLSQIYPQTSEFRRRVITNLQACHQKPAAKKGPHILSWDQNKTQNLGVKEILYYIKSLFNKKVKNNNEDAHNMCA